MKKLIVSALLGLSVFACKKDSVEKEETCSPVAVSFMDEVIPIFQANCNFSVCHSASGQANGIVLDSYANVTSTTTEAKMIGAINHDAGFSSMPKSAGKLDACTITTIEVWFEEGAKDN
jgi:hypothetical protein